jgi:ABC-2 type transport system ATP-binding protein
MSPKWLRYTPKFTLKSPLLPFGELTVDLTQSRLAGGGPPVSAGRFDRARTLAGETLEVLDLSQLGLATDRLLALADEFEVTDRSEAKDIAERLRTFQATVDRIPAEQRTAEARELFDAIRNAVTHLRRRIAQVEDESTEIGPPRRQAAAGSTPDRAAATPAGAEFDDAITAIRCDGVAWAAKEQEILHPLELTLERGTVVGIVGHNGAGKTTLLQLLAQEERPTAGEVVYPFLAQRGYHQERLLDRIGFVPQISVRYPGPLRVHLTTFAALRSLNGERLKGEVDFALARFGLLAMADRRWSELSGGFRTRVDLARATIASPDILILDEPLGPLDSPTQREYLRWLRQLADSRRKICVIVTSQDIHAISEIADQIVVLRDGALAFAGPPTEIEAQRGRHIFEVAGDFDAAVLQTLLTERLDDGAAAEVQDRGSSQVVQVEGLISGGDVVSILISAGRELRYFRDLSRSPELLLEDNGGA